MAEDIRNMLGADTSELLKRMKNIASDLWGVSSTGDVPAEPKEPPQKPEKIVVRDSGIGIDNLWMTADETIDWTDALAHDRPSDGLTDLPLWQFYHECAKAVLNGDLTAYTEVLRRTNPLGELTLFGRDIVIKAPDPDRLETTFTARDTYMEENRKKYLSAMGVRIARDLLACLPVGEVGVTAVFDGKTVMTVTYRREQLHHRNFSFLDPEMLTEECGAVFEPGENGTEDCVSSSEKVNGEDSSPCSE